MTQEREPRESNASLAGATAGSKAGASNADLKRGYTKAGPPPDPFAEYPNPPEGGFVGRPLGWER